MGTELPASPLPADAQHVTAATHQAYCPHCEAEVIVCEHLLAFPPDAEDAYIQLRQIARIAFSIAPASVRIADIQQLIEKSEGRSV